MIYGKPLFKIVSNKNSFYSSLKNNLKSFDLPFIKYSEIITLAAMKNYLFNI